MGNVELEGREEGRNSKEADPCIPTYKGRRNESFEGAGDRWRVVDTGAEEGKVMGFEL